MPRQLPWKVKGNSATTLKPPRPKAAASPSPSRSPAPPRPTPTRKPESTPDPSRKARRSLGLTPARSPSTSPPPEPLKEEFMIEGADNDDQYRMVEDEFLAVAGDFTKHLHAAEYQRLKGLVKSQNAEAIQNISRPVTGEMSDLVKRRHAALDTAARQRRGISKTLGKRSARNSPPRRSTSSLQGLMDSPRKQAVPLTSMARPGSSFREGSPCRQPKRPRSPETLVAKRSNSITVRDRMDGATSVTSVRVKQEPATESDEDDDLDDLDRGPRWTSKTWPLEKPERALERQLPVTEPPARQTKAPGNPFSGAPNAPRRTLPYDAAPRQRTDAKNDDVKNDEPDDDDDFFSRMRARRAEQKRRRQVKTEESNIKTSESQAAALNEIPFM